MSKYMLYLTDDHTRTLLVMINLCLEKNLLIDQQFTALSACSWVKLQDFKVVATTSLGFSIRRNPKLMTGRPASLNNVTGGGG